MSSGSVNMKEEEEEEEDELKFECAVCLRRFKSGKALGGHKRMHNTKKLFFRRTHSDDVSGSSGSDCDDTAQSCRLCGKGFRSEKSLFGHMRSHPERGWRGIHPPPPPALDLSWSLTGPRGGGRKIADHYSLVLVPGMDRASRDAVLDLMMLKATKSNTTTIFKCLLEEEEEEDGGRRKKVAKKEYACSVCHKSFTSYQALGGHRSSHNKLLNSNTRSSVALAFDLNHSPPPDPHS